MKHLFLVASMVISACAWAQKPTFAEAKATQATVYFSGAELTHTASANIPKGTSELVIKNVANELSQESIRVLAPSNVTVLSAQFTSRYLSEYETDKENPVLKRVQDSITLLEKQLKKLRNQRSTEEKTIDFLDRNEALRGHQDGIAIADIPKVTDYYTTKRTELLNSIDALSEKEVLLAKHIALLNAKLDVDASKKEKLSNGKIILQVMSPIAQKADFQLSYYCYNAYWRPFYELRAEKLSAPIHLLYKGQITQKTGVNWKGIKLSLSSGNPNQNNQFPVLKSWHLRFDTPANSANEQMMNRSALAYASKTVIRGTGTVKDSKDMEVQLEESTVSDYTYIAENQLNVSFDINTPYDILSNGKAHSVSLQEMDLKAQYKYYVAPRVNKEVYLVAAVEDYSKYNLLAGDANIVFEGLYVGKTSIDPNQTSETLNLTMGNDRKISVKREKVVDKSQTKFISSNKEQIFTFDITVRNNKKEKVDLVLKDQYPISTDKSIEVELLDSSKASVDEQTHILTWELSLKPNEVKTFRLRYKVKYPKEKVIGNL